MYKYSGVKNVFAYLSHLNDSDHQTNVYITQKFKLINFEITISFIKGKKAVQTCLALREKVIAPKSNNWLCHPLQQHLQSSIRDNGQWVFIIAVEEFWPTILCRIVLISHIWGFLSMNVLFKVMPQHPNRI